MKKISALLLTVFTLANTLFLSSCKDNDDDAKPAPTMTIVSSNLGGTSEGAINQGATGTAGDVVLTYKATAGSGIKDIKIDVVDGSSTSPLANITSGFSANGTEYQNTVTYSVPSNTPAGTRQIRLVVTDKDNRTASKEYTVRIVATRTATGLSAIGQGTDAADVPSDVTLGTFYNGDNQVVQGTSAANGNRRAIDWAFNFVSGQPRLVGPDDAAGTGFTGDNRADTKFSVVTTDFDAATASSISGMTNPTGNDVTISSGNVIMFYNPNTGRKGLVRINNYTPVNAGAGKGYIRFDVKQNM